MNNATIDYVNGAFEANNGRGATKSASCFYTVRWWLNDQGINTYTETPAVAEVFERSRAARAGA